MTRATALGPQWRRRRLRYDARLGPDSTRLRRPRGPAHQGRKDRRWRLAPAGGQPAHVWHHPVQPGLQARARDHRGEDGESGPSTAAPRGGAAAAGRADRAGGGGGEGDERGAALDSGEGRRRGKNVNRESWLLNRAADLRAAQQAAAEGSGNK